MSTRGVDADGPRRSAARGSRPRSGRPHPHIARRRRAVRRQRHASGARLALAGAAALGCAFAGWWLATGPVLAVRDVRIRGYDRGDAPQLREALADAAGRGGSLIVPPVGSIRRTAVRFPWVADVVVHRDLPAGLTVQIVPAAPAAVLVPARGGPVLVSPAGLVMGPAGARDGLARIRVRGEAPAVGARVPAAARAPLTFALALDPSVSGRVRGLALARGAVTGRLASGPELRLGPPVQMRAKAMALEAIVRGVRPSDVARAGYVELSEPDHPALGGLEPVDPADAGASAGATGGDLGSTPSGSVTAESAPPAAAEPAPGAGADAAPEAVPGAISASTTG